MTTKPKKQQQAVQLRPSVTQTLASKFNMDAGRFEQTLRATVVPAKCSHEEFAAFCIVANEYNLNPITKEIYAFPKKGGGIQPIVSIDGWLNIINSHPAFDGMDTIEDFDPDDANKIFSVTCRMHRKDRKHPVEVTEYLSECAMNTEPWKKWPVRMLRHKATIQAARYSFGFSGIIEEDEFIRHVNPMVDVTTAPANFEQALIAAKSVSEPTDWRKAGERAFLEGHSLDAAPADLSAADYHDFQQGYEVAQFVAQKSTQQESPTDAPEPNAQADDGGGEDGGQAAHLPAINHIDALLKSCKTDEQRQRVTLAYEAAKGGLENFDYSYTLQDDDHKNLISPLVGDLKFLAGLSEVSS